jgi:glycosyltransferase involved in cell wall biosynthesis
MEIIYILPDKNAGVASVVRNLLKYKSDKYKTKTILLHDSQDDNSLRIKDDFKSDVNIRIEYNGYWNSKYFIARKIKEHLNANSIIISNDGAIELFSIKILRHQIPVTYILHGDYQHYYSVIKEHLDIINGIIGVSKYVVSQVDGIITSSHKLVRHIKFPVPTYNYNRVAMDKKIRIAFVGTLNEFKGVLEFDKIIREIEAQNIPYHFNIIGDGPLKKTLLNLFKFNVNVSVKGKVDNSQVLKLHSEHDILILPSKNEGLPVSIVEAMKAGVVPIASNIKSGIPELIQDGITGYKVDTGKECEYANHISNLYKNADKLHEMSQNCMDYANATFNPEKQTLQYELFFENIFENFRNHNFGRKNMSSDFINYLPNFLAFKIKKLLLRKE